MRLNVMLNIPDGDNNPTTEVEVEADRVIYDFKTNMVTIKGDSNSSRGVFRLACVVGIYPQDPDEEEYFTLEVINAQ